MTINKNNIEAYLLDYMEGNLDPLLTAELMAFLAENPEFEKYLPDNDSFSVIVDTRVFESKENLKKDYADVPVISPANFDEFCIAATEGLLNNADLARLNSYIADDPILQKDFELYRHLRLKPDRSVKFGSTGNLKKPERHLLSMRTFYIGIGVAASIAILVSFFAKNQKGSGISPEDSGVITAITKEITPSEDLLIKKDVNPIDKSIAKIEPGNPEKDLRNGSPGANNNNKTVDSKQQATRETLPLKKIDPLASAKIFSRHQKELADLYPEPGNIPDSKESSAVTEGDETLLSSLISKVDLWKTAETAINGFNQLTESRLSISKTTDESGNIKSLQVHTESYTIASNNLK